MGLPIGPCYGPLLDSGGVNSQGLHLVHGIVYTGYTTFQIRGPFHVVDSRAILKVDVGFCIATTLWALLDSM